MYTVDFMAPDKPNFIWKGKNAFLDMDCIIENELPEIMPEKRYETLSVAGRNGELHETFDDYVAYDYPINGITIPYNRLSEVKRWLRGRDRLITHNDSDKYRDCICSMNTPISFENEIGVFYTFDVTFRCQPFRKKVRETPKQFAKGDFLFVDPGDEVARPLVEVTATGGDFTLEIGSTKLTVINALPGKVTIDNELGKIIQGTAVLFSKGSWLKIQPGMNKLNSSGAVSGGLLLNRSVWL